MDSIKEIKNCPVCCVLGHVDVGKTKFLDKLRRTNVQLKEIGKITQQIGSTYFDKAVLEELTKSMNNSKIDISGLMMIDTPGHDCFTQMRMTGAKICNTAIIIVDIVKGLEKQTIQCIELLKKYKTNFIIALNKIDKIYGWKPQNNFNLKKSFDNQSKQAMSLLKDYMNKIICQLAELGINAIAYYENKNSKEYISMIPISAHTGEGIADLVLLISKMSKKIIKSDFMEQLDNYNHGFLIDVKKDDKVGLIYHGIFMNKEIKRGDKLFIEGFNKIIKAVIKEIYIPDDQIEMKSKTKLMPLDIVNGTKGIALKFVENEIDNEINIGGLFMVNNEDMNITDETFEENMKKIINNDDNKNNKHNFDKCGIIINVPSKSMADAVIQIIKDKIDIKIMQVNIGTINRLLISKAASLNNKYDKNSIDYLYNKRYMVILDYNSNIIEDNIINIYDQEIINLANNNEVKIIHANIIYKLFDKYNDYINEIDNKIKMEYPNVSKQFELQIIPKFIFLKKSPLLFGVKIINGKIRKGMSVMATNNNKNLLLGKITGIQKSNKDIDETENGEVCIKIEGEDVEYGKQFDDTWKLIHHMNDNEKIIFSKYKIIF